MLTKKSDDLTLSYTRVYKSDSKNSFENNADKLIRKSNGY